MDEPYICPACLGSAHERCISRAVCECVHEVEHWLTPDRRAELRAGADPADERETELQSSYRTHRAAREAADARRS